MCNICKCLLFLSVKASPGCIIGHLMEDAAIRGRIFAPFPSIPPTVYHSIPQYAAYHPPATKPKNGLCDQIYQYHLPVTDFRPWGLLPAVRVSANSNLRQVRKSTQCWFPDIEKMCPFLEWHIKACQTSFPVSFIFGQRPMTIYVVGIYQGGFFELICVTFFSTSAADFEHFLHWVTCVNWFLWSIMPAGDGNTKFWTHHLRFSTRKLLNMDYFQVFNHFFIFCISFSML